MAAQAGLRLPWSQTTKTGFLMTRLILENTELSCCLETLEVLVGVKFCQIERKCHIKIYRRETVISGIQSNLVNQPPLYKTSTAIRQPVNNSIPIRFYFYLTLYETATCLTQTTVSIFTPKYWIYLYKYQNLLMF